jgi:hypothetical protein
MKEHDEAMLALLRTYGMSPTCWVYGSPCRPLLGMWFHIEGAQIVEADVQATRCYSYAIVPRRLTREEIDAHELVLISRPAREP